jgi:hypothetical protein
MGKGKGAVEYWAAVVKPGRIMFEVGGVPCFSCKRGVTSCGSKAPVKTKFVVARDSKHNLYYIMKQSEIKDLSAAELQEKLSLTKKTYADLKWLMLYHH